MKRKSWARLSPETIKERVIKLETIYGVNGLAELLGVSRDSVRRYREGRTLPQTQKIYKHINALYYQNKNRVAPEKVEKRKKQIKNRTEAQKYGIIKTRYASMQDYIVNSPLSFFNNIDGIDKLYEMGESGYCVAWRGRDVIPLEVQFMAEGEGTPLSRFGKALYMVCIVSFHNSPKDGNWKYREGVLMYFKNYVRNVRVRPEDSFEERHRKVREFLFGSTEIDKFLKQRNGSIIAYLGFYFKEGDEL